MTHGYIAGAAGLLLAVALAGADEPAPNAELARAIHRAVVEKMPRQFEDASEWGATVPLPVAVRFPRLRRTVVRVGDHDELPHGTWKRTRVTVADPARDLTIEVPDVRKAGKNTTRVRVEATVAAHGERERRDYVKGVQLLAVTAEADAVVKLTLDVDVTATFDLIRPLEGVKANAAVADARLDVREFHLRRVGPVVVVEEGPLGDELKAAIGERLKALEPRIKEQANAAVAELVKDGKFSLPSSQPR